MVWVGVGSVSVFVQAAKSIAKAIDTENNFLNISNKGIVLLDGINGLIVTKLIIFLECVIISKLMIVLRNIDCLSASFTQHLFTIFAPCKTATKFF